MIIVACNKEKGCADATATNYSSTAEEDDGSCKYNTTTTDTASNNTGGTTDTANTGSTGTPETVIDADGNTYKTVKIGSQTWMAENLKTTKFSDGASIENITDTASWRTASSAGYAWYKNDVSNKHKYGALYNYFTVVDSKNVCPIGWHVPSESEWDQLHKYLTANGHTNGEGDALKTTTGWAYNSSDNKDGNGSDNYGFSAVPAGSRGSEAGQFDSEGELGVWWTNTEHSGIEGVGYFVTYNFDKIDVDAVNKVVGLSARCLKD